MSTGSAIIVGAGPAGLMAADRLSAAGTAVTIHERMASPARKFLMAGRGGLNLTHSEPLVRFLIRYNDRSGRIADWLARFGPDELRAFAAGLGQETFVGSSGRVFPKAMKASPMLRAWLARLERQGVQLVLRSTWTGWDDTGQVCFEAPDGTLTTARPDALVIATGGASWPKLGSDGSGLAALAGAGVASRPFEPSNCGVLCGWSPPVQRFGGTVLKAVALSSGEQTVRGDVVITQTGLEGGPVYGLGQALRAGCSLALDLRPDQTIEALSARLSDARPGQSVSTTLKGRLKLTPAAIALTREAGPLPTRAEALARLIKAVPIQVTGFAGMERAISSAAGVSLEALNDHLMLKDRPGVFVAGELLDWDAPTGGYLLQACFASGVVAAEGVIGWLG